MKRFVYRVDSSQNGYLLRKYFQHTPNMSMEQHIVGIQIGLDTVAFVSLEVAGTLAIIHLGMVPEHKTAAVLSQLGDVAKENLYPFMRDQLSIETVRTACDADDTGTIRMLGDIGMSIRHIAMGTIDI